MAGQDGVTPLNASNLIGKQSADSMNGSLTMIGNGVGIFHQGAYQSVPVYFQKIAGDGNPKLFDTEFRSYEFMMVFVQNPSSFAWVPRGSSGGDSGGMPNVFVYPAFWAEVPDVGDTGDGTYYAFQKRRAGVLEFTPISSSQDGMYAEGDLVASM